MTPEILMGLADLFGHVANAAMAFFIVLYLLVDGGPPKGTWRNWALNLSLGFIALAILFDVLAGLP